MRLLDAIFGVALEDLVDIPIVITKMAEFIEASSNVASNIYYMKPVNISTNQSSKIYSGRGLQMR